MTTMVGLLVEFKAKSTEIDAQFNKVNAQVEQLQNRVAKANDAFGGLGGAIKTAFAGISIGYIAHELWDIVSASAALYDQTQKLGISVTNYQALSQVSREAGVSQESLNNSLSKLKITIGDADMGTKKAMDSLKLLGLTAKDFQGKELGEEFTIVSSKLAMIKDDNLRAAVAMQIFGKGAKEILGFVTSDVKGSTEAFKALNSTLSQTQAADLDRLTDSIDRLWNVSKGKASQVFADAVPTIEALGSKLSTIANTVGTVLVSNIQQWSNILRDGLASISPILDPVLAKLGVIYDKVTMAVNGSSPNQGAGLFVGNEKFGPYTSRGVGVQSAISGAEKGASTVGAAAQATSLDGFIRSQMAIKSAGDSASKALTELAISAKKLTAVQDALDAQGKAQSKEILAQAAKDTQRPLADSTQFQKVVDQLIKAQTRGPSLLGVGERVSGDPTAAGLKSLQDIIKNNSSSFDTSGLQETLKQLTAYLQNKSVGDQQAAKVDLNVTVSPSPDFITKTTSNVVKSPQLTEAVKQQWYKEWGNIARGAGVRGR